LNLELMRRIDEEYLKTPFYGWPRMIAYGQGLGYPINVKRARPLMDTMGLCARCASRSIHSSSKICMTVR